MALVALLCSANPAWGQEVTATITGTVSDPSGAPIVGASVAAKDTDRGTLYTAQTNEAGVYNIVRVPVGGYELKVEMKGFQTALVPSVTLVLNQTARIDVQMKVGQVTQTVEVTSQAPLLQTERTELGTIIDSRTNDALPLATRNYVQLTMLAPGAAQPDPNSMKGDDTPYSSGGRPYINGNREQSNNFLLDGVDNNQVSDNLIGYSPSVDAIQEFNLITQNAPAEFGSFQGGIVNVSIKSGTNSFHGDAFEFFRNDKLNANSWQNNLNGLAKNKLRYNMFGATFGGPIKKNKLFIFADYQGQRFNHPQSITPVSLFTTAERAGNFGALCKAGFDATGVCNDRIPNPNIANPPATCASGAPGPGCVPTDQLYDPFHVVGGVRQPVPSNNFANTSDTIDLVAKNLFGSSLYPQATTNNLASNFFETSHDILHTNQGDMKVDYNISEKDRLFGRYSQMYQQNPSFNSFQLFGDGTLQAPAKSLALGWFHVVNSNVVNDVRIGVNYVKIFTDNPTPSSIGNFGTQIGINNSNDKGPGLLGINFNGANIASSIGSSEIVQRFADTVFQYGDALTITRGRHVFHTGFQYHRLRVNTVYAGNNGQDGFLQFSGQWTQQVVPAGPGCTPTAPATTCTFGSGLPEADFWLGLAQLTGRGGGIGWGQRANLFAGYVQDDWRATNSLTLNLGLRYETQTPWVEVKDRQVNFGLLSGTVEFAGKNRNSRALYDGYYTGLAFQPRIGFAWTPAMLNRKTVVRGAYTVSTYMEGTGTNLRLPQNAPFNSPEFETQFNSTGNNLPTAPGCASNPCLTENSLLPPPPNTDPTCATLACFQGASIRLWAKNYWPAIVQQWNLSIQEDLGHQTTLQVGYVGQHGTHLANPMWLNQEQISTSASACAPAAPPCAVPGPYVAGNPTLKNEIAPSGGIRGTLSNASQRYDALQATLQKRYGAGLEAQVAYTYSKCRSDSAGYYGTWGGATQASPGIPYWQNIYDQKAEWGPCFFDQTHALTSYAVYEVPVGHGRRWGKDLNKAVNGVVGNWSMSGILSLHTGFPLTVSNWSDPSNTNAFSTRLNCSSHPRVLNHPTSATSPTGAGIQWFDPSVFSVPSPFTFGNCGNGIVRGPGLKNFDMSLTKGIPFSETRRLEFRTDFINLTNTPILGAPSVFGPAGSLGHVASSQGERQIQFALKFYY
jgi:hypothetical protein